MIRPRLSEMRATHPPTDKVVPSSKPDSLKSLCENAGDALLVIWRIPSASAPSPPGPVAVVVVVVAVDIVWRGIEEVGDASKQVELGCGKCGGHESQQI